MLAFVPAASLMTAVHRDHLVLVSYAPQPEIQPLESRDQYDNSNDAKLYSYMIYCMNGPYSVRLITPAHAQG